MKLYRPDHFMILPTLDCQASCTYCFAKKTDETMAKAVIDKTIDFIERIAPSDHDIRITFHGGEPLLAGKGFYEYILPRLREVFGLRAQFGIQSNLWRLDEEMIALIRKYRIVVGTSIDGYREMCDDQRGSGYFDRSKASEKLLRKNGIIAGEICTFAAGNTDKAAAVFAQATVPYSIHGAVPSYGAPTSGWAVDVKGMERLLLESYEAYKRDPSHCRIKTIDAMAKGCFDGQGHICTFSDCLGAFAAIAPDGSVYSCQRFCGYSEFCLGKVTEDLTQEQILKSSAYLYLCSRQEGTKVACRDCTHYDYCVGGCLYNSITAGTEKDPYCESYRATFERIGVDMALEMGGLILKEDIETPVLAMAGDQEHPYDARISRKFMLAAVMYGKVKEGGFPDASFRNLYPENNLNKLYLHLTFDCPLHCAHCYADGGLRKMEELSPSGFAKIIQEAADRCFRTVVVTGGEPLVYFGFDRLLSLVEGIDKKGSRLVLRSSFAFPIPKKRMEQIATLFDEIIVSVDGDRDIHDARRGSGRYDWTVSNLEQAVRFGFSEKLGLCCTLSRTENDGAPGDCVRALAERLQIRKLRFRPVLPLGRGKGVKRESRYLCSEEMSFGDHFYPRFSCGLGQNLYVEPNGDTYPCYAWCEPDKRLGNLAEMGLGELLDTGKLYEYCKHDVDTNEKCRYCEVRYLCGGICKAWAEDKHNLDSGNFDCTARKEYFACLAKRIQEVEDGRRMGKMEKAVERATGRGEDGKETGETTFRCR